MKVRYQGIDWVGGQVAVITVDYAGRRARIPLPHGFKGTLEEVGQIVRQVIEEDGAALEHFDAILPLIGAEWDIPDAEPAAKPKPTKMKKW